jgi:putative ABC transport system permease protein
VTQRRGEIGLLRALGATRATIAGLFVSEGVLIGALGSAIGLLLGDAATGLATSATSSLVRGIYGVGGASTDVALTPRVVAMAVAVGLGTSALAAMLPARAAARVDPVKALQKGRSQAIGGLTGRTRGWLAAVLAVLGALIVFTTGPLALYLVGVVSILVAALLLTPFAALGLTRGLRPALCRIRPVEGALAADSLIAAPMRTSATVAALMLSLALVIALRGTARGSYARITDWMNTAINADFFVTSSPTLTERTYRFPASMGQELSAIDGIQDVHLLRTARIQMDGNPVLIISGDLLRIQARSPRRAVAGSLDDMFQAAASGKGVIASENFAALRHVRLGDRIEIPTPAGSLELPLVGVVREYSDQQGALFLDRTLFVDRWQDDTVDLFRVFLAPGASADEVKQAILTTFAGNRRLFVLSNTEVRSYVTSLTDQWFSMSSAQLAIAIVVAILGIVNSLTVSVADRRRELGILRALGGFPNQVRWAIWMEAFTVGLVSVLLGLALGAVVLYLQLELSTRNFPGFRFDYLYPYGVAALLVPIVLLAAIIGAVAPAESAVRGSLVEALEYE